MSRLLQVAVPNHLGDAVMALPALSFLASELPDLELRLVGRALAARVLDGQGPWGVVQPRWVREKGSAAVLLAPSLRVAIGALRARADLRVGTPTDARGFLLTHSVDGDIRRLHQREIYARTATTVVEALTGAPGGGAVGTPRFAPEASGALWWEAVGKPRHLLHPWAEGTEAKRWPLQAWVELGRALESVVVTGGPGAADAELAAELARRLGVPCSAGRDCLSPARWAEVATRVDHLVLPDTGLAHLAAAAGARPVVLFGATDPARYAPPSARVVRASSMRDLTPGQVLDAVRA